MFLMHSQWSGGAICVVTAVLLQLSGCAATLDRFDERLASVPADKTQVVVPNWAPVPPPPYPLTLVRRVEVDLSSIRQTEAGNLSAWTRDTYIHEQIVSAEESFRIGEARYGVDCARGVYDIDYVQTRKADGQLVRSRSLEYLAPKELSSPVPPNSLESNRVQLICEHAPSK